ncbi:unnamed protein product [Linum tenue]|uniref:Tobamovirus multiplication protein 2B n=1 Tax=Linum tenue TaxID=586396 RepID=A0AAV0PKL7_9ROSI|nr:unnamed protein product [Linum tenue]
MAIPPPSSSSGGSGITTFHPPAPSTSTRGGTAKAAVAEQISQTVQSTFNLLQLMQETSPSQAQLSKLPKNLLAKASTMKNTGQILEQLPQVISTLDAHMENGLQRGKNLDFPPIRSVSYALIIAALRICKQCPKYLLIWRVVS